MSASKCLTEINKVQSFLRRINAQMADAICFSFYFFLFLGGREGKLHFERNKHHEESQRANIGDCEDQMRPELSSVVGYCLQ